MIVYLLSSVTDYPEKMTALPARGSEIEGGEALAPTPKALHWLGHLQDMLPFRIIPCYRGRLVRSSQPHGDKVQESLGSRAKP
jgi:hypothetical protein